MTLGLIIPASSADCERGFSVQNRIKNKGRAALLVASLANLMLISIEGPAVQYMDNVVTRAYDVWKNMGYKRGETVLGVSLGAPKVPTVAPEVAPKKRKIGEARDQEAFDFALMNSVLQEKTDADRAAAERAWVPICFNVSDY